MDATSVCTVSAAAYCVRILKNETTHQGNNSYEEQPCVITAVQLGSAKHIFFWHTQCKVNSRNTMLTLQRNPPGMYACILFGWRNTLQVPSNCCESWAWFNGSAWWPWIFYSWKPTASTAWIQSNKCHLIYIQMDWSRIDQLHLTKRTFHSLMKCRDDSSRRTTWWPLQLQCREKRSFTSCEQRVCEDTECDGGWCEGVGHSVPANNSNPSLLCPHWLSFPCTHSSSASMHRDALLPFAAARQEAASHFFSCSVCCYNTNEPSHAQTHTVMGNVL